MRTVPLVQNQNEEPWSLREALQCRTYPCAAVLQAKAPGGRRRGGNACDCRPDRTQSGRSHASGGAENEEDGDAWLEVKAVALLDMLEVEGQAEGGGCSDVSSRPGPWSIGDLPKISDRIFPETPWFGF